ncbi:Pericentrin [Larimichthys crocea]|uniref:Uncharacterized protein n=1 Tax=Larimichthys crocea TaxID=215358 RepID=A0ACD3RS57_LARCR|nr:Pericentrin [Larimichthys crocea]
MVSELTGKHNEDLNQLRESMEAAHQAELQQALVQKTSELEALRLNLMNVHTSQLEQESALTKVQASMRDSFAQESALLQAQHQSELNQIRQQNQEQHRQEMNELKQQWETSVAQERAATEGKAGQRDTGSKVTVGKGR